MESIYFDKNACCKNNTVNLAISGKVFSFMDMGVKVGLHVQCTLIKVEHAFMKHFRTRVRRPRKMDARYR